MNRALAGFILEHHTIMLKSSHSRLEEPCFFQCSRRQRRYLTFKIPASKIDDCSCINTISVVIADPKCPYFSAAAVKGISQRKSKGQQENDQTELGVQDNFRAQPIIKQISIIKGTDRLCSRLLTLVVSYYC
jgi:hypothetical protein